MKLGLAADEWLRQQDHISGLSCDDEDSRRFEVLRTVSVHRVSDRVRKVFKSESRAEKLWIRDRLHGSTIELLGQVDPDKICQEILGHMLLLARKVLNKNNLQLKYVRKVSCYCFWLIKKVFWDYMGLIYYKKKVFGISLVLYRKVLTSMLTL